MIKKKFVVKAPCTKCGENLKLEVEVDASQIVPNIRARVEPDQNVYHYTITTADFEQFITEKAKVMIPDIKIHVTSIFPESEAYRRGKRRIAPIKYAALQIAFSDKAIQKDQANTWTERLGINPNDVIVVKSLFENIIKKYSYNRKSLIKWANNFKDADKLDNRLNITETFLNELIQFSRPRAKINEQTGEVWIFFCAAPEAVLADMFTNPDTDILEGKVRIDPRIRYQGLGNLSYSVNFTPGAPTLDIDPNVKSILMGAEKNV